MERHATDTDRRVVVAVLDGPWGPVRLAAGVRGVVALETMSPHEDFVARLARRGFEVVPPMDAPASARAIAGETVTAVGHYLAGADVALDRLPVDLAGLSAWDRLVLEAVRAIPRGRVVSYGGVARRIGRTGAARAVGGAVGRNPVGLLIPCHRVVAGDGSLGGYGVAAYGGAEAALAVKRELLALEGVRPPFERLD